MKKRKFKYEEKHLDSYVNNSSNSNNVQSLNPFSKQSLNEFSVKVKKNLISFEPNHFDSINSPVQLYFNQKRIKNFRNIKINMIVSYIFFCI